MASKRQARALRRSHGIPGHGAGMLRESPEDRGQGLTAWRERTPAQPPHLVAAWFGLRAEDRGAAAVALHALRGRAARIIAGRCRCGLVVAEDHVADAVFVMVYGIRRAPRLRISAATTLAYLCGVARNEWRWARWRRAREAGLSPRDIPDAPVSAVTGITSTVPGSAGASGTGSWPS